MPQTGDPPSSRSAVVELAIPIEARILRARRRKEERAVLLVRRPAALGVLSGEEAPVVAALRVPAPHRATYWPFYRQTDVIAWVRHDGTRFWRPMAGLKGQPVRPEDLAGHVEHWALEAETWRDWPYALGQRHIAARKPNLLAFDDLTLSSCSVNAEAEHAARAADLARKLCLVDGCLHVSCGEPVIDILVKGLSAGKPERIIVAPSAGPQHEPDAERDVLQTFRGDAARTAEGHAMALGAETGLPVSLGARWEIMEPRLARSDEGTAPSEGLSRIADRTAGSIGRMGRPVVEAWLDLRDAGRRDASRDESVACLERLSGLLTPKASQLAFLVRWEILRWSGPGSETKADMEALGALA